MMGHVDKEEIIKVTVIVTVHNAEKYLRECLDSVITQTLKEVEILCVDGGSKDCSPEILKEYAKRDNRIRIINDKNTSYGHKVNIGIQQAMGEYVSVLESDDMYRPDMLERLYSVVEKYGPDYVNADYLNFFDINGKRYYSLVKMYRDEEYGKILKRKEHLKNMKQILRYWTGIFRKDFLLRNGIRMNESPGASFQDMSFRFLTSILAETSYHINMPVYLYRIDNPASSVYDVKKVVVIADEFDFLKKELLRMRISDPDIWRHFYIWKYNDFHGNLIRFEKAKRKELFDRCYSELQKDKRTLEKSDEPYTEVITKFLTQTKEAVWNNIEEIYCIQTDRNKWLREVIENLNEDGIVIFGCGKRGRRAIDYFKAVGVEEEIRCCTDNLESIWCSEFEGHLILSPGEAVSVYKNARYIVTVKGHESEIAQQLQDYGVDKSQVFFLCK